MILRPRRGGSDRGLIAPCWLPIAPCGKYGARIRVSGPRSGPDCSRPMLDGSLTLPNGTRGAQPGRSWLGRGPGQGVSFKAGAKFDPGWEGGAIRENILPVWEKMGHIGSFWSTCVGAMSSSSAQHGPNPTFPGWHQRVYSVIFETWGWSRMCYSPKGTT